MSNIRIFQGCRSCLNWIDFFSFRMPTTVPNCKLRDVTCRHVFEFFHWKFMSNVVPVQNQLLIFLEFSAFLPHFLRWGVWCSCLWSVGRCDSAQPPGMEKFKVFLEFGGNLPHVFFVAPSVCLTRTHDSSWFMLKKLGPASWISSWMFLLAVFPIGTTSYGCSGPWDESNCVAIFHIPSPCHHILPVTMWFIHFPSHGRLCPMTMPVVET